MISETRFTMIYAGGDLTQTVWTQVTPRDIGLIWIQNVWHRFKLGRPGVGPFFCRNTRFEVCLVISVDPDQVLLHAASGRSLHLYCSQMHLNFWVVFCRQSHLGCTDMSLQQNRDKMPKFASLSNYTYQISYTLIACVKYMFCILCIVVTMSL